MVSQPSTALSDLVLALSAVHASWFVTPFVGALYARMGFLLIAIAASLGVCRFGLSSPGLHLIHYHQMASRVAGTAGLALLAAAMLHINGQIWPGRLFVAAAIACPLAARHMDRASDIAVSAASVMAMVGTSIAADESNGTLGGAVIIMASVMVGTDGHLLIVPRVDVFHYLLAASNWLLLQSFQAQAHLRRFV